MQKRDKSGRFLKGKSVKKKAKKVKFAKPVKKVIAQKVKKYLVKDLDFCDLKDMISAEVALQMRY